MLEMMIANPSDYIKHYMELERKFENKGQIHDKFMEELKSSVKRKAEKERYKFQMYLKLNLTLEKSPYLTAKNDPITKDIIRFRLGSHYLPIETGRWCRKPRNERICRSCMTVGDEEHYVYDCPLIEREGNLQRNFSFDWLDPCILRLFRKLKEEGFL